MGTNTWSNATEFTSPSSISHQATMGPTVPSTNSMLAKAFQISKKHLAIDKANAQTFISIIPDKILKRAKGDANILILHRAFHA